MYIYETGPIDYFSGLIPIDEAVKFMNEELGSDEVYRLFKFVMECSFKVARAKNSCWYGDVRGKNLYVFGIPDPDYTTTYLGLVWKQDDNGTSFICSPVALPWIDDRCLISDQ